MYHPSPLECSLDECLIVYQLAVRFDVEKLETLCNNYIMSVVQPENLCLLLSQSQHIGGTLYPSLLSQLSMTLTTIPCTAIEHLTLSCMKDLLNCDDIRIKGEEALFELFLNWSENFPLESLAELISLFRYITFCMHDT